MSGRSRQAGWLISFFDFLLFSLIGGASLLMGTVAGVVHGLVFLAVLLPLLPYLHPRMASKFDGPSSMRRLEPPGFLALHHGSHTPLVMPAAYAAYGAILGWGFA